ncbi:MAG: nicotinate phosphoribosyltransferase [Deltaproteobacteria bacterium]|nr:nicotinate phosphoribosyltransferase [Deltaproteobacteria bacterium]
MSAPGAVDRPSLALLTDLYQLTMAYGSWRTGTANREAVFHLFFRQHPFRGGFTIACGLADVIRHVEDFRFVPEDLAYLATLPGGDGRPLFGDDFLAYLGDLRFTGQLDATPEGTVVFPNEPLIRVQGPIVECQLLETALLNLVNFQTLIATKAARVCLAARGEPVLEFGLRRAQGVDGGLSASRAAYIGGCTATSNVLAGKRFGIPVRGTHAHSWVMCFDEEREAFRAYAEAMPNNCVFLVDTYDTLEGVRHAVEIGRTLREGGHRLLGIRLDSGDLAALSTAAREILDAAGFHDAAIVASNDLDEQIIASLKDQGARIDVWGVGTKLVTAYDQPALGGVYKLAALRSAGGPWEHRIKLSEQPIKVSTPGIQQVRRYERDGQFVGDVIYDLGAAPDGDWVLVDAHDTTLERRFPTQLPHRDLLVPIFRDGVPVYAAPQPSEARKKAQEELGRLPAACKRFLNPQTYPTGLERGLYDLKLSLIRRARGAAA